MKVLNGIGFEICLWCKSLTQHNFISDKIESSVSIGYLDKILVRGGALYYEKVPEMGNEMVEVFIHCQGDSKYRPFFV